MTSVKTNGISHRVSTARAALEAEIECGRFLGLERLPGERDLAGMFSVSRTTLRKAVAELIASGLLYQRHGFGTFVSTDGVAKRVASPRAVSQGSLVDLNGSFGQMVYFGEHVSFGPAPSTLVSPSPDDAINLRLETDERVWRKSCVVLAENQVVAIETTLVPQAFRAAEAPSDDRRVMIEIGDHVVARTIQRIRTVTLDRQSADLLSSKENTIGFSIERTLALSDRRCVALRRFVCRCGPIDCVHDIVTTPVVSDNGSGSGPSGRVSPGVRRAP